MNRFDAGTVRALVCDVFGTVVDWRGTLIREGEVLGAERGWQVDWPGFADAWRAGYAPAMARVNAGEMPWANLDALHRTILDAIRPRFRLDAIDEADVQRLHRIWHRLDAWPDSVDGLRRLKSRVVIAPLSNGNVSLLVDTARHAGLPWDCVLSSELFRRYKPDPAVYLGAAQLLGVAPGELMMVAAHPGDLVAARGVGLRTAYLPRPMEHGPGGWMEPIGNAVFDIEASDFGALADRLGA